MLTVTNCQRGGGLSQGNRVFNIYDMNWLIAF